MKFSDAALSTALVSLTLFSEQCNSFTTSTLQKHHQHQKLQQQRNRIEESLLSPFGLPLQHTKTKKKKQSLLHVSTSTEDSTDSSSSSANADGGEGNTNNSIISNEVLSGKRFSSSSIGIEVVDYASVSDQNSNMEKALTEAREKFLLTGILPESKHLMGINDEVVQEVGREIGQFEELVSDASLLQSTASYIRSKAKPGFFETRTTTSSEDTSTSTSTPFFSSDKQKYEALLDKAYEESGEVTSAFAKTFYLGTQLLPPEAQKAIWAVYVWCRRTDEIVDAPRNEGSDELNNEAMLQDLACWELRLENLWKYGEIEDVLDLPLLDSLVKYPDLPIEPFVDMIRGMLMDIPVLGVERYKEFDELHLYCYRVAGTVGLMSMPIFGTKNGITYQDAKESALSLGVAFQITNILRDVGEDAIKRKRIYLPTDHLKMFNVTEEQLFSQRLDQNYINLMKYEIDLARKYYQKAQEGVYMLSEESRLPVQTSLDCYRKILDKIEDNGYDSLTKRAYVDKWEKMRTIPFSWYRTQEELSKALPLPEDW
eukprot:CAMPEP_0178949834 /NCGR_PEP_ID=MMETSP0789-20121207/6293_1 /TAXON_ID=3005 /ORGANISM="Rhizosolenia setigera, Strain CCMP 1694" /LENGTH=540 /DNA_ID=CAMNT_0020630445 /DNA_START=107 /DNA_END=1729 /DNA_ORIENTATION=+